MAEKPTVVTHVEELLTGEVVQTSLVAGPPKGALPARVSLATESERLEELENDIYSGNLKIVHAMTRFAEVTPDMEGPTQEWIDELGLEEATRQFRIAKASWMAPKDAPVALTAANKIVTNLAKARATRDAGRQGQTLNVLAVFPVQPARQYEELVVGDD